MRYIYTHTNQQTHAHTHTYTLQNIYYIARIKLRYPWFNVTHQLSVLLKSSLRGLVEGENLAGTSNMDGYPIIAPKKILRSV